MAATAVFDAQARTSDRRDGARSGIAPQLWCVADATHNALRGLKTASELSGCAARDLGQRWRWTRSRRKWLH